MSRVLKVMRVLEGRALRGVGEFPVTRRRPSHVGPGVRSLGCVGVRSTER